MTMLSGVTVDTTRRRLLGEGVLYKNYGVAGEARLGAVTQGEWDPGIELAEGVVAGAIGVLKGMDHIASCKPTLQMTLLELTAENLAMSLPGGEIAGAGVGSRVLRPSEWLGLGDGIETVFPLEEDYVWPGSLRIWGDVGFGPVLMTESPPAPGAPEDYSVDYPLGDVTFVVAPPAAVEGTSRSGLAPILDMETAHATDVDGMVAMDGGPATPVLFDWTGCVTGALIATQIQAALVAAGFAGAICVYVPNVPGTSDYYLITSPTAGAVSQVICTTGGADDAFHWLKLGTLEGGTEVFGGDAMELTTQYHFDPGDGLVTHDVITSHPIDEATDYITNLAWLGRCADQPAEEMIIIVKEAFPIASAPMPLEVKGAVLLQVTFRGSVTGAAPQELPFEIRRPVPA